MTQLINILNEMEKSSLHIPCRRRHVRSLTWILAAALSVSLTAGCGMIHDEPCPDCPLEDSSTDIHVDLHISCTSLPGDMSRSDSEGHPEEDPDTAAGYDLEYAVYPNQLAFYIFIGGDEDARLLYYNDDVSQPTDSNMEITGSDGSYTVSITIPRTELESMLGHTLSPSGDGEVTFRMIALANAACGFDRGNPYNPAKNPFYDIYYPNHPKGIPSIPGKTTFRDVIEAAEAFSYRSEDLYGGSESNHGEVATGVWKGAIPMFGSMKTTTTERALYNSQPYQRVDFGEILLLRSLAKIRIHDRISTAKGSFPRLHSVRLTYDVQYAMMLPADALVYENGRQVHTCRSASADAASVELNLPFLSDNQRYLIGYIPEQAMTDNMPELRVVIQTAPFAGTTDQTSLDSYDPILPPSATRDDFEKELAEKTISFTVPMSGYNGEPFTWGKDVLRNHVYDLNVEYGDGSVRSFTDSTLPLFSGNRR